MFREMLSEDVASLCKYQPSIEQLELGGCYEITSSAVAAIANHLTKLKSLGLQKCRMVINLVKLLVSRL